MKTLLSNAIESASLLIVEGYEIDDLQMEEPIVITLPDGDGTVLRFDDQEIEIDSDGDALVNDEEGENRSFTFRVSIPLRKEDLIKRVSA